MVLGLAMVDDDGGGGVRLSLLLMTHVYGTLRYSISTILNHGLSSFFSLPPEISMSVWKKTVLLFLHYAHKIVHKKMII